MGRFAKRNKNSMDNHGRIAVSVLVAVYEPNLIWLEALLRSVEAQSFCDFEVRVLDDCSKKPGFAQIQNVCRCVFGSRKNRYISQNEENIGSNRTFEKLSQFAQGRYLAFCDQDDVWEPYKLERLFQAAEKNHAVMAYSDMTVIDGSGRRLYDSLKKMRPGLVFAHGRNQAARYIMDNCTAACSMLVRAAAVRRAVPFPAGFYCDQWIAACAAAWGKIVFVEEPLVRYRRHGSNQTASLARIKGKKDYYDQRVIPAGCFTYEMQQRGIHYKWEKEMQQFVEARQERNLAGIWKYRKFGRKYAFLDIAMLCLPEFLIKGMLSVWRLCRKRNGGTPYAAK